jgi:protein-disulfide isomerase
MTTRASLPGIALGFVGLLSVGAVQAQVAQITPTGQAAIVASPATPFAGNPKGTVTIVEYFDVNCPQCRVLAPNIAQLIATDSKVRVLYKDWPIFGGVSVDAAKAELAARWQGRYLAAHDALMTAPSRLRGMADVRTRMRTAGVDLARLDHDLTLHGKEIDAILSRNQAEASKLALQGTPGLVIGRFIIPGALSAENLRTVVKVSESPAADGKS